MSNSETTTARVAALAKAKIRKGDNVVYLKKNRKGLDLARVLEVKGSRALLVDETGTRFSRDPRSLMLAPKAERVEVRVPYEVEVPVTEVYVPDFVHVVWAITAAIAFGAGYLLNV